MTLMTREEFIQSTGIQVDESDWINAKICIHFHCRYQNKENLNEAINLIGQRGVTLYKIINGMPLFTEDYEYIIKNLK